jgi:hypothetical protein
MVEDLKEIRNLLDKFILKYEKQSEFVKVISMDDGYKFEHDSRLKIEFNKLKDNKPLTSGMEGCAIGNDYY